MPAGGGTNGKGGNGRPVPTVQNDLQTPGGNFFGAVQKGHINGNPSAVQDGLLDHQNVGGVNHALKADGTHLTV